MVDVTTHLFFNHFFSLVTFHFIKIFVNLINNFFSLRKKKHRLIIIIIIAKTKTKQKKLLDVCMFECKHHIKYDDFSTARLRIYYSTLISTNNIHINCNCNNHKKNDSLQACYCHFDSFSYRYHHFLPFIHPFIYRLSMLFGICVLLFGFLIIATSEKKKISSITATTIVIDVDK